MEQVISLLFVYILIENFVLQRFFGVCPLLGTSRRIETAAGMGMATILLMTLATLVSWLVYTQVLLPLGLHYLHLLIFIMIIAVLGKGVEALFKSYLPYVHRQVRSFLPLVTLNCAVLAAVLLVIDNQFTLLEAAVFGFAASVGFSLVLLIMAGVRERLEVSRVPVVFQGAAITLIVVGVLSFALTTGLAGIYSL